MPVSNKMYKTFLSENITKFIKTEICKIYLRNVGLK